MDSVVDLGRAKGMSEKRDYYEVLGIERTATNAEIDKAYGKIAMKCHPDRLKNKTEEEKVEARKLFEMAGEAKKVLLDATQRSIYDKHGHAGLQSASSGSAPTSTGYTPKPVPRRAASEEETFAFFDKFAARQASTTPNNPANATGTDFEARRAAAAAERARQRQARLNTSGEQPSAPATTPEKADNGSVFSRVASAVVETADKLRGANGQVEIPLDALEKFRENLADFLAVVDGAIQTAKSNKKGPQP